MRKHAAALGALLVLAGLPVATADIEQHLELSSRTISMTPRAFDTPALAFADFDGDGTLEIVAQNDDQHVYVFSSVDESLLARFRTKYPTGWNVRSINEPAAADVDGDGKPEIVVVNSAAFVCVYEFNAAGSTRQKFDFVESWCKRMNDYNKNSAAADAGAWVEDVDGDGKAEIYSQIEDHGIYAFKHDGEVLWKHNKTGGNSGPVLADLKGDGKKTAIFFGDAGEVRAFDAMTGDTRWTFWASGSKGVKPASIPAAGNVGDLDGDGKLEIVFMARSAENRTDYSQNHMGLFVLEHNGELKWMKQPDWAHPMSYTHPIIADLDEDGDQELLALDWNTIGHKPGDWEPLGDSHVFAFSAEGREMWMTKTANTWSNDDIALGDVDGDGKLEVVTSGYKGGSDGLLILDAATGAVEKHVPIPDWTVLRGPQLADLDGDGDVEIVVPVNKKARGGAILVFETGSRCDVVYGGWQNRDPCRDGGVGRRDGSGDSFAAEERKLHRAWCALTLHTCEPWSGSFRRP